MASRMSDTPISQPPLKPPAPLQRMAVTAAAIGGGLVTAVAVGLWAHYGTAVFYETILAGLAACF